MRSLEEALGTFCIMVAQVVDYHLLLLGWTFVMLLIFCVVQTSNSSRWDMPLAFLALLMTVFLVIFH